MRAEILIVTDLLRKFKTEYKDFHAYAFGSAISTNREPNDIDILVIYSDLLLPQKVRDILKGIGDLPIHLIFLTKEEEIETNFIEKQKCVAII